MSHIEPTKRRTIITGVGFRGPAAEEISSNIYASAGVKPNIGAVVALAAARAGYSVTLISKTQSKLTLICDSIRALVPTANVAPHSIDLLDEEAVDNFSKGIPEDREVDLVHCAGLSAGSYTLPDDNPYLPLENTPLELPGLEFQAVVKSLLIMTKSLLGRWKKQTNSRLVVVSSMSGVRAVPWGFSHASAKGGLRQAVRSLTLELNPLGVRVSEVQPGIVDTGLYDSPAVQAAITHMGHQFGYEYEPKNLPTMEATAVAEAVMLCLSSHAHILAVSMVAPGQFPHLGS